MLIHLDEVWFSILYDEINKPYFKNIFKILSSKKKKIIYPEIHNIFRSLKLTKFNDVNVIMLGQDPYCEQCQANGIAFSVPIDTAIPSSLKNIYKELHDDTGITSFTAGDLTIWAKQGILLLNSILTTENKTPMAHTDIGWETLTDNIIKLLSNDKKKRIFVLLGQEALTKTKIINIEKNIIISAAHPSIKSAHKGFFGSRIFTKINLHLKLFGIKPINW